MIIVRNPKHKPFPSGASPVEKMKIAAAGRITVGEFVRVLKNSCVHAYLPRIGGRNFASRRHRRGYNTPDQALTSGYRIRKKIRVQLEKSADTQLKEI